MGSGVDIEARHPGGLAPARRPVGIADAGPTEPTPVLTRNTYASLGLNRDKANILLDLRVLHEHVGQIDHAIECLKGREYKVRRTFLELLVDCYRATGNHDAAAMAWQQAVDTHTRLRNLTGSALARLQAKLRSPLDCDQT